ncbi:hypothetical protein CYY_005214 [Polysphondylium violaceum]|uniref:PH domain-containing protein n=1 Tax=Polysphondylium violaceum TaxID=133409 RepID=A0A8J4PWY4_9MYCE|nr:hypothetical protein CYY_005214 [Polysphondylium violaceum]
MEEVINQPSPSFLTNHNPKDKDIKKRKKLDGQKESSSPLNKLRSATLTRGVSSKLQFVVDLGSNFSKSPSKSTTNALSLHSSVPSHYSSSLSSSVNNNNNNNNNNLSSSNSNITFNNISGGGGPTTPKKKQQTTQQQQQQQQNNTLRRKSVRISQHIKMDEVMKIYAPLSGSEYLNKNNSTSFSHLQSSINKENQPTNQNVLSPPNSPSTKINLTPSLAKESSYSNLLLSPTSVSGSPTTRRKTKEERLSNIRKDVVENAEFILGKMGEYQRCVLSLPDLFMLSVDILHSEYEYLIKDTNIISKILLPLDSMSTSVETELVTNDVNNLNSSSCSSTTSVLTNTNLTEMDLVAQSISNIAKKLLTIEIEIKKPNITEKRACILSNFVKAVKQYLETKVVPEMPTLPSEIAHSLIGISGNYSDTTTQIYQPEESNFIYKSGYLVKKGTKGPLVVWKDQYFTLSPEKLCIYSNQNKTNSKAKKEILLNNITSIGPVSKNEYKSCFMIKTRGSEKQLIVRAPNDREAALWMLAIDGLPRKNFETNHSCINLYIKETLLETLSDTTSSFRRSVAGGVVRSSHGEEWTWRADGTLFNTDFLDTTRIRPKELQYKWNGQLLVPCQDSVKNLGYGKWNGIWLAWYNPNSNTPFIKYIWDQEHNEYLNQNPKLSYKWSSRGLVSKVSHGGEWMVEGRVPETVVMFLQCLRYIRHKELDFE